MTVEIVLAPGTANEKTISESDIVGQLNPAKVHTGLGDFAATIKPDTSVDPYAERQDRVNVVVDGSVVFTGFLHRSDRTERDATQAIGGPGIGKKLEETRPDYESLGGALSYSSISLEDAIRDYWGRTPFDNYTVYNQSTNTIVTDQEIQSADTTNEWDNVVALTANIPFHVDSGQLKLAQTCFTREGEDTTTESGTTTFSLDSFSDGVAESWTASGDVATYDFTPQYTIPSSAVSVYGRLTADDSPEITATLNGDTFQVIDDGGIVSGVTWEDFADTTLGGEEYTGGDLNAGNTYTLKLEATTSGGTNPQFNLDVIAPLDNRFSYTFDNDNGGNGGFLSGPELYPDSSSIELLEEGTGYNISEATVTTTWNDTSGSQAIAVSNDSGANYLSASNTNSTTKTFNTEGRNAQVKFTFSRFGSGANSTPTTGFNGQAIDTYTLEVDGNDLVVIDELELSRDHFSNLQTLHNYGDFVWSIDHTNDSISNIPVHSFLRGDQTQTSPSEFDDPIDEQSGIKAGRYYNVIYVQGASNSGGSGPNGRPVAEVKADSTVINNDNREITGFIRDQSITTKSGAVFRGRALLDAAQSNADLIGNKTIPPVNLLPGFSYSVDFGDGPADKVLETIDLSYGEGIESTAQFAFEEQIADEIKSLKSESRNLGNQV